jgi:mycothione reductase
MDRFDLIVIGAGAGLHVASVAAKKGWEVALVDQGPLGGVCLNTGCTPSKILIYPADVVRNLEDAAAVGIEGKISRKDFQKIMNRMHFFVDDRRRRLEDAVRARKKITLYKETAEFVSDCVLKVGDKMLTAPKIVIASGARAMIPPLPGLKEAGYLDHATLLKLDEPPRSMIIIGAGFVGCEYGHFFSAMGTEVTILGRSAEVLNREDPEVCRIIKMALSRYMNVLTSHEAIEVKEEGNRKVVLARNRNDGKVYRFEADEILVATGRRSNADILNPNKTGVETDEHGWIKTNDYLETTRSGIWAIGDALGKNMFRHAAKYEAEVASHNILYAKSREEMVKVDFHAVPHAVATHPAVAGVGLKEAEALAAGYKVLVGRVRYTDMVMGFAMDEENGFIKAVAEEETGRILGCSIVGAESSSLIQQVVYLMNKGNQDLMPMMQSEVIHPTLSELLVRAFSNTKRSATSMRHRCKQSEREMSAGTLPSGVS